MTRLPRQYQAEPVRVACRIDRTIHVGGEPEPRMWTRTHIVLFAFALLAIMLMLFVPTWWAP